MKSKIMWFGCLLFISFDAMAECSNTKCNDVKIKEMHVFSDGTVWLGTTGTETNLTNCTTQSSLIKLDTTTGGGKNIYSALLAAQARDQSVQVRTMDNVNPCQIVYIITE